MAGQTCPLRKQYCDRFLSFSTLQSTPCSCVLRDITVMHNIVDIRKVTMQKQRDCWWLGDSGKCHNFYIMIGLVSICAVFDIIFSVVVMSWSGGIAAGESGSIEDNNRQGTSEEIRNFRYALAV
jgi:hypothetical protein